MKWTLSYFFQISLILNFFSFYLIFNYLYAIPLQFDYLCFELNLSFFFPFTLWLNWSLWNLNSNYCWEYSAAGELTNTWIANWKCCVWRDDGVPANNMVSLLRPLFPCPTAGAGDCWSLLMWWSWRLLCWTTTAVNYVKFTGQIIWLNRWSLEVVWIYFGPKHSRTYIHCNQSLEYELLSRPWIARNK